MKSIFSLILAFLITLPNCGMVFAGNMDQMIQNGDTMEIPEIVSPDMMDSQDETLQNPYYTCCSDATHNSILERDTSITNATKNVIPITSVHTLIFREKFIPEKKDSISALHRPNAPPDPSEYISLIGSSVKNLN